ncbi:MAG: GNAT family N-acetyltransferase [Polyangiaceae bacterium]|jgi:GNAT superfamily N-acetyltransferase
MIRPGRPADASTLAELIRELARYEHLEHEVAATADAVQQRLFETPHHPEVLVAEEEGKVVGYAVYFENFSTFLMRPGIFLEDVFVLPAHRRKGLGRALLSAVARIAVDRGCGRFEWMALDWNTPADEFYRSHGAERLDPWRMYRVTGAALAKLAGRDS